jgi:hypothetical protein
LEQTLALELVVFQHFTQYLHGFLNFLFLAMIWVGTAGPSWNLAWSDEEQWVEFSVQAECIPESVIHGPTQLRATFRFVPDISGPATLTSLLWFDSGPERPSEHHVLNYVSQGWVSALFKGPHIKVVTYCEGTSALKKFHMSYHRVENLRLGLNTQLQPTPQELDGRGQPETVWMDVPPAQGNNQNEHAVGEGTSKPFWLQVSIPFQSRVNSVHTTLFYRFF